MATIAHRFAARLHNLRKERGLSQAALASGSKLNTSFISALERSAKIPSLTSLEQLAKGLKVDLPTLVDFPDTGSSKDDRVREEIELVIRLLRGQDLNTVRRCRKSLEAIVG